MSLPPEMGRKVCSMNFLGVGGCSFGVGLTVPFPICLLGAGSAPVITPAHLVEKLTPLGSLAHSMGA